MLINKHECVDSKHCNDLKAFIDYSNDMVGVYENIEECNPNRKRKILIEVNDMIADMLRNKTIQLVSNNQEFQQIIQSLSVTHSSDIDFKDFTNRGRKFTAKPYSFLVNDAILASDKPLCFRRNILE